MTPGPIRALELHRISLPLVRPFRTALGTTTHKDALLVRDADGGAFLDPAVLTRTHTAAWVWPLFPFAVVYDVVAVPVLLVFAPAVIIPGD